jgi:hypothetical protein
MPIIVDPVTPRGVQTIGYSSQYPGAYGEYVIMSAALTTTRAARMVDWVRRVVVRAGSL